MPTIIDGTTGVDQIQNGTVTEAKIANGAVTDAKIANGAVTDAKIAAMAAAKLTGTVAVARLPAGSVLQVVSTLKTDRFTTTSGSMVDITGYSATITPSSATSKILVVSSFHVGNGSAGAYPRTQLLRDSTVLGLGDSSGSATRVTAACLFLSFANNDVGNIAYTILDSPNTTSSVTYKWQMSTFSSRTGAFNGGVGTTDSNFFNTSSTITLMEIAA